MDNNRRGVRCGLSGRAINELLYFLSTIESNFYIPWQLAIESRDMILPKEVRNVIASEQYIRSISKFTIWELELHIYPYGKTHQSFEIYEDFLRSSCICCLIYYDCGWLSIYIKGDELFCQIYDKLLCLQAEDLVILTEGNDSREALHL